MKNKFSNILFSLFCLTLTIISSRPYAFCEKIFLISSEFQIGKIKHMVEKAPPGIYISVGSERSFRGASMAPQITRVYLLDISLKIHRFNQINIELLKAPKRQDYLRLRWEVTYDEWKKFNSTLKKEDFDWWQDNVRDLEKMGYPLPEALNKYHSYPYANKFQKMRHKLVSFYQAWRMKEIPWVPEKEFIESITFNQLKDIGKKFAITLNVSQEEWNWWVAAGKNKDLECPKIWLDNPEQAVDLGQVVDYRTGNYLFDDKLYERLHDLAIKERFINMRIDLADEAQLEKFLTLLKREKSIISVLDLDNLYFKDYMGQNTYKKVVEKFLPLGQDTSLLVVMNNYKDYACGQFQIYIGFTFENIRHWPSYFYMQSFFDTLPKGILDLINGRVYEKEETPPLQYLLGE